jgi:hypothetical protein
VFAVHITELNVNITVLGVKYIHIAEFTVYVTEFTMSLSSGWRCGRAGSEAPFFSEDYPELSPGIRHEEGAVTKRGGVEWNGGELGGGGGRGGLLRD